MTAEAIFDRALALTALPPRTDALDVYGYDHGHQDAAVCYALAVRMARLGDEPSCLLALQEAARKLFRYEEAA